MDLKNLKYSPTAPQLQEVGSILENVKAICTNLMTTKTIHYSFASGGLRITRCPNLPLDFSGLKDKIKVQYAQSIINNSQVHLADTDHCAAYEPIIMQNITEEALEVDVPVGDITLTRNNDNIFVGVQKPATVGQDFIVPPGHTIYVLNPSAGEFQRYVGTAIPADRAFLVIPTLK